MMMVICASNSFIGFHYYTELHLKIKLLQRKEKKTVISKGVSTNGTKGKVPPEKVKKIKNKNKNILKTVLFKIHKYISIIYEYQKRMPKTLPNKVQISKIASKISGYFYSNVNLKLYFRSSQQLLKLL